MEERREDGGKSDIVDSGMVLGNVARMNPAHSLD